MRYQSIVTTEVLENNLSDKQWVVFDCRFNLVDTQWGEAQYALGHIPGAVYVDLNEVLSAPVLPGKTGRHPLPTLENFSRHLEQWGVNKEQQIVIYDQKEGMFAARFWWLLRWCGFQNVAVLDGGWASWLETKQESKQASMFEPSVLRLETNPAMYVSAADVLANIDTKQSILLDARSEDRFRGENETMDVKGGHIPGAISSPFLTNLATDGRFLTPEQLQLNYKKRLGETKVDDVIVYCGSGVTATHNILAMYHAGMGMAKLYPGSWSEWITDDSRPIA